MQAACPTCSHKIVIDDAKVPDRPFSVKCPKCQNVVKFPGKGAAAAPAAVAPPPAAAPAPAAAAPPPPSTVASGPTVKLEGKALVSVGNRGQAAAIATPLTQVGLHVDTIDNPEEAGRLAEQGVYSVLVTNRAVAAEGQRETLYQRVNRLAPENRRRVFLILLGDEFRSGEPTQAYSVMADLVLNPRDVGGAAALVGSAVEERNRLYAIFNEVRRKHETSI